MATLYTDKQMAKALKELRIAPINGKVNAEEAARILSWRVKAEQEIDFEYKPDAIRQHVRYGNFEGLDPKERGSKYPIDQVFRLPLAPQRAMPRKEHLK